MIQWRKSSHSGGSTTDHACVEVADLGTQVGIRDSKNPGGPHLSFSADEFGRLLKAIKRS